MITYKFSTVLLTAGLLSFTACESKQPQDNNDTTAKASATTANTKTTKTVLFFGDSLTAGLGLDDPATDAFPGVVQQKIKQAKLPYNVINAGNSGETSAGGLSRIDWVLKQKVDVFVLELGANDGLRGLPISETSKNLQAIIDRVKAKYPQAKLVITGMQMPPSMGADYTSQFKNIFPKLAAKNDMALVPFLLDHVGGIAKLNQNDGIHPTKEGAEIVANNVWSVLKDIL